MPKACSISKLSILLGVQSWVESNNKGCFDRLSSKPTEALKFYNKCRGDKTYNRIASIEMANVCLNPENEIRSDEDWRKKNPK